MRRHSTSLHRRHRAATNSTSKSLRKPLEPLAHPIAALPSELLLAIFEVAVQVDSGDDASQLSRTMRAIRGTCRRWRDVAYQAPALWRNTSYVPSRCDTAGPLDIRALALLGLHAKLSKNTISHATLSGETRLEDCYDRLAILHRSVETLTHLELHQLRFSPCERGPKPYQSHHGAVRRVLRLISAARNLECLYLSMHLGSLAPLEAELVPDCCHARPREVHVAGAIYGWSQTPKVVEALAPFMTQLVSRTQRLTLNSGPRWDSWASSTLRARAGELRFLSLHLTRGLAHEWTARATIKYPALEELRLYTRVALSSLSLLRDAPPWCAMPALRAIVTFPSLATKIDAPLVECAQLLIAEYGDVQALEEAIASWPHLRCLCISIVGSRKGLNCDVAHVLTRIVDLLTPSRRGKVVGPNLTHLGLTHGAFHLRNDADPQWAARPWRRSEDAPPGKHDDDDDGELPARIVQLELQRWKLHAGQRIRARVRHTSTSTSAASKDGPSVNKVQKVNVRGPCRPLQSIKLRGIRVEESVWRALTGSGRVHVMCRPEARGTGTSV